MTAFAGTAPADTITPATVSPGVLPVGLFPDGNADSRDGLGGNDTLDGGGGADVLYGGFGNDRLFARGGLVEAAGGNGNHTLDLSRLGFAMTLKLETGANDLGALISGFENVLGSAENNSLIGSLAANRIAGGAGADGGDDYDFLDSTALAGGLVLDLVTGVTGTPGLALTNFEAVYSGSGNDLLTGSSSGTAAILSGGAGNDMMAVIDRGDSLYGDTGNHSMLGFFAGFLSGGDGDDLATAVECGCFEGGDGSDCLTGGFDADTIYGGSGIGRVSVVGILGNSVVRCNTDADADFEVTVVIQDGAVLASTRSAADFLL